MKTPTDPSTVGENWPTDNRTVARAFDAYSANATNHEETQRLWEKFCRLAPQDDTEAAAWLRAHIAGRVCNDCGLPHTTTDPLEQIIANEGTPAASISGYHHPLGCP